MKKGELVTGQIVMFILLVVSFVIILWVYSLIAFPAQIDTTTCHESVILRATTSTLPLVGDSLNEYVPLQCKTKKICLGGNCEEFAGAKNVLNIKAKNIDDDKDIEKEIAQEMVECWTMMGEGKVNIFSEGFMESLGFGKVGYPICVVCSRIAINKEEVSKKVNLSEVDPVDYMFKHKVSGLDISYYEFFSGDSRGVYVKDDLIGEQKEVREEYLDIIEDEVSAELEDVKSEEELPNETPEIAIVFMQISSPSTADKFKRTTMTALFGGYALQRMSFGLAGKAVSSGVAAAGGVISIGTGIVVGAVGVAVAGAQAYSYYGNQQIVASSCGDISLGETVGCSSVRAIPYDVENLKNYCGYIDSIA